MFSPRLAETSRPGTWAAAACLAAPRRDLAAALVDGVFFAIGGQRDTQVRQTERK